MIFVRLLLDATFATSTYTLPISSGWVTPPEDLHVAVVPHLSGEALEDGDAALLNAPEILRRQHSHAVLPEIAVVANSVGTIAMRTPVRPDEVEQTPIRLLDTGSSAEFLARATLHRFYGISASNWVRDDHAPEVARAEVVIVDGAEALREPEGGFSEDLCRAWFILTAQPVVTHLLLVPRDLPPETSAALLAFLDQARSAGLARRKEWRPPLAEREGIISARAGEFWSAQRLRLTDEDRPALLHLLRDGSRGTTNPPPTNVSFIEGLSV